PKQQLIRGYRRCYWGKIGPCRSSDGELRCQQRTRVVNDHRMPLGLQDRQKEADNQQDVAIGKMRSRVPHAEGNGQYSTDRGQNENLYDPGRKVFEEEM